MKQRQQTDAFKAALKVRTECELKLKHGIAIQTKTFKDVARLAIERMATVPKGVKGYASMGEYKSVLERYHMPFFDRTHITSIDYEKLGAFDVWRAAKFGRAPAQSTLKTHNAALQRVFDEAVIRKWMTQSKVPSLSSASGATDVAHWTTNCGRSQHRDGYDFGHADAFARRRKYGARCPCRL
ncbi:MAG: hypothetical protein IPP21_18165 [Betaproteobacteria bacterium]|nr:hypothetical protein [Betaproteobacteria bacterium]